MEVNIFLSIFQKSFSKCKVQIIESWGKTNCDRMVVHVIKYRITWRFPYKPLLAESLALLPETVNTGHVRGI